jgi:hypothetical protein
MAAKGNDGVGSADGPEHARLFEAAADDGPASGFDDAGPDKQALCTKGGITHSGGVAFEVVGLDPDLIGQFGNIGVDGAQRTASFSLSPLSSLFCWRVIHRFR